MTLLNDSLLFPDVKESPQKNPQKGGPLAFLLSPKTMDDYVGQDHLLSAGKPIRLLLDQDRLLSMILWGPPGCGKTSLAKLMSVRTSAHFISINAVTAKIQEIKDAVKLAQSLTPKKTILFIDEIHRFSKIQQDALLPSVEDGTLTLIGATTENPFFSVIPPLVSRSRVYELFPLEFTHLKSLLEKGVHFIKSQGKELILTKEAKDLLISNSQGDARKLLTLLDWISAASIDKLYTVTPELILSITQTKGVSHNVDDHYDLISALIKSIRGSDIDASIYWLARLLKGGEDPLFIVRRLIILASEDIGMADKHALPLTTALLDAVKFIGMPEIQINFSHVVAYLAKAPKSNATYLAIKKANELIDRGDLYEVPNHLKDSHYKGAQRMGYGKGYVYPHDLPTKTPILPYWDGQTKLYKETL